MIPNKTRLPLAEWRKRKLKLSQLEASKLIGVRKGTLSNYERGTSFPDVPIIKKIEKVYGIKYDQIIFLLIYYGLTVILNNKTERRLSIWIFLEIETDDIFLSEDEEPIRNEIINILAKYNLPYWKAKLILERTTAFLDKEAVVQNII